MKKIEKSFVRRALIDQRGQVLPLVALGMVLFMGMAGLTIDVGHAYIVRSQLQGAAGAAALAGVPDLFTTGTTPATASTPIINDAKRFSASPASGSNPNGANYNPHMGPVTTTVSTPCISALMVGNNCGTSGNHSNAVRVTETAQVPTYFMTVFGFHTLTVAATATAAPQGAKNPYNIAIILDATPSMNNRDSNCNGNTEEQCAMNGIATMLHELNPCISGGSCSYSSAVTAIRVSLFSFPNVLKTTLADDYNCGGIPTGEPYTLPLTSLLTSTPTAGYKPITYTVGSGRSATTWTGTYQILDPSFDTTNIDQYGFTSDYYSASGTNGMNPNSILVKIMGNGVTNGCMKEPDTSHYGSSGGSTNGVTSFAGAIYAAQAALQAEKASADVTLSSLGRTSTNVIIFVSDGQANTGTSQFPEMNGATSVSSTGVLPLPIDTSTGAYPSAIDPCQQAMVAAHYAKTKGTTVYGIAYGSETSPPKCSASGSYDGSVSSALTAISSQLNVQITAASQIIPCVTVENIADSWPHFFAESSSGGCSTTSTNAPMSSLASIFEAIGASLGAGPRLIPNTLQ
jgi:Flp pilus assembly protein TadG